ncbi:MAG: hypothetical protein AAGI15_09740 [Pseudomonadota bacterium]
MCADPAGRARAGRRACLALGLVLALLTSSGARALVIFGLDTEHALPAPDRGASQQEAPPLLLQGMTVAGASERELALAWPAPGHWWTGQAKALPVVLREDPSRLWIALDRNERPFWLQLRSARADCTADLTWLDAALTRKYPDAPEPTTIVATWGSQKVPATQRLLGGGEIAIASACLSGHLLLEYRLNERALTAYQSSLHNLERAQASYERITGRAYLQHRLRSLLLGDRSNLQRLLGYNLRVDDAVEAPPEALRTFKPETDAVADPLLAAFMAGAEHQVRSDDLGGVLALESEFADPDQSHFDALVDMLRASFGLPRKRAPRHKIYRFGPQRLILRWHDGKLRLVYRDLQREEQAQERQVAAERATFEADTDGL